jgi:hypothetical protein
MPQLGSEASDFNWLVDNFANHTPGVAHAMVVSADGLPVAASQRLDHGTAIDGRPWPEVGFGPGVCAESRWLVTRCVGEVLRRSAGPSPRPARAEVARQPVRPVPPLHSVFGVRSLSRHRLCGLPVIVLWGTAHAYHHPARVI